MTDKLLERLDALAAKLGVTATHLWSVMVRQATVEAKQDAAIAILWLLIVLGSCVGIYLLGTSKLDDDLTGPVLIFLCVVILIGIGMSLGYGSAAWTAFANPEYWALKHVAELVK